MSQVAPRSRLLHDKKGESTIPLAHWWAGGEAIPEPVPPAVENTTSELFMGGKGVVVYRMVPPKLVGRMGERETGLAYSCVARKVSGDTSHKSDRVKSGVLFMDHTRFTVSLHKHMFAELGILSIPYPQNMAAADICY